MDVVNYSVSKILSIDGIDDELKKAFYRILNADTLEEFRSMKNYINVLTFRLGELKGFLKKESMNFDFKNSRNALNDKVSKILSIEVIEVELEKTLYKILKADTLEKYFSMLNYISILSFRIFELKRF